MIYADGFDDSKWKVISTGYTSSWQTGREYAKDMVVVRGNTILRCIAPHTSAVFDNVERNNWEIIAGKGAVIPEWQANTEYGIDEAIIYNDVIYRANTNHISGSTFSSDMNLGSEKWRAINSGGGAGSLLQVTKLGVVASVADPKIVELPINMTTSFNLPPVEVLKFETGLQDQIITSCEFNNADSSDFIYDEEYVEFDGKMKLKTNFAIPMSTPIALGSGFISESEEIDFAKYKKVEAVG